MTTLRLTAIPTPTGIQFAYDGRPLKVYNCPRRIKSLSAAYGYDLFPQTVQNLRDELQMAGVYVSSDEIAQVLRMHMS